MAENPFIQDRGNGVLFGPIQFAGAFDGTTTNAQMFVGNSQVLTSQAIPFNAYLWGYAAQIATAMVGAAETITMKIKNGGTVVTSITWTSDTASLTQTGQFGVASNAYAAGADFNVLVSHAALDTEASSCVLWFGPRSGLL